MWERMFGIKYLAAGMKRRVLVMAFLLPVVWCWIAVPPCLETTETLAKSLCGEFSNSLQANQDKRFASARVWFRPMTQPSIADEMHRLMLQGHSHPTSHGFALYQESALLEKLDQPYKQSVVFVIFSRNTIRLHSHKLETGATSRFRGMAKHGREGPLQGITADILQPRQTGCDMIVRVGKADSNAGNLRFKGLLETGRQCSFQKGNCDTFLESSFELLLDRDEVVHYLTEDKFIDAESGRQVWGSEHGPYCFQRVQKWALGSGSLSS